jgi:hypothetical protein
MVATVGLAESVAALDDHLVRGSTPTTRRAAASWPIPSRISLASRIVLPAS